jgi:hypothetical protein
MIPFELESGLDQPASETPEISTFILSLLQVRDQAHILHWQTTSVAQHQALGDFYGNFLDLVDTLAEEIMGKYGRFKVGGSAIVLMDYDQALPIFIANIEKIFCQDFECLFDKEDDTELYNIREEFLSLKNKLSYLLTLS